MRLTRLAEIVRRYPGAIVAVTLLVTAVCAVGLFRLTVDTSQRGFFPEGSPEVEALDRADEAFGGSDYILIAASSDDIFTPHGLQVLKDLTDALQDAEGVSSVMSPANMVEVRSAPWGLDVVEMLGEVPEPDDFDAAADVRRRMSESSMLSGILISEDGDHVLTLVQLGLDVDAGKVGGAVKRLVDDVSAASGLDFAVSGAPILNRSSEEHLIDDALTLLPAATAVIVGVLLLSFRTAAGVLLPLTTVLIGVVWVVGIMGLTGIPVNQISAVLPVVLLSTGSAYGIHMMHRYYEELHFGRPGDARDAGYVPVADGAAPRAVRSVGLAIVMAGVTTVAGFGSNVFSSIARMREFGLLAAMGVACALLISLTFLPAVLVLLERRGARAGVARAAGALGSLGVRPDASAGQRSGRHTATPSPNHNSKALAANRTASEQSSKLLANLGAAVLRRPAVVAVAVALLVAWSAVGLVRLQVDSDFASFFDARSVTRRDFDLIRREFGGVDTVQIIIEGDILEPAVLRAMETASLELQQVPGLGRVFSVVDVVKQVSLALHDNDPAWNRIPDTRDEAAQYLLLASFSGDLGLERMLSLDQTQARIQVMADSTMNARAGGGTLDQARDIVGRRLAGVPGIDRVDITGLPLLGEAMGKQIVSSQFESLALAAVSVLAIIYLSLGRSWSTALCMAPIALTVLANFGLMGWTGLPVNLVTALVSSIAVGMGIDYSVHVYTRYTQNLAAGAAPRQAMLSTIVYTGQAVVVNAVSVAAGFIVTLTSKFPPVRQFGALISFTMAVSALGALTLLPVLLVAASERSMRKEGQP